MQKYTATMSVFLATLVFWVIKRLSLEGVDTITLLTLVVEHVLYHRHHKS